MSRRIPILEGDPANNVNGARASKIAARTLPLGLVPKNNDDPQNGLPCDSEPHGADPGWFRWEEDMGGLVTPECGGIPDHAARPARLAPRPASEAARRPFYPYAYAIAGGMLGGIAAVLLGLFLLLEAAERSAPGAPSSPPPAHVLMKGDRLT